MKKFYLLLLFMSFAIAKTFAQCPDNVNVNSITYPTCGSTNGAFNVDVKNASGNVDVSIDGGTTYTTVSSGVNTGTATFTNLAPASYAIVIRMTATPAIICQSFNFILRAEYDTTGFTTSTVPATGCTTGNGSITITGGVAGTDSIAWISSYNAAFVPVSSLAANNIPSLKPGTYYVVVKSPTNNYCYSTHNIVVSNSGTACPSFGLCGTDSTNLFTDASNGTFGSGGNSDGTTDPPTSNPNNSTAYDDSLNGPSLLGSGIQTNYIYQALGPYSPQDGFYAIANNTWVGTYFQGGGSWTRPFYNEWYYGHDHDDIASGGVKKNGYMMLVNATYDPSIVIEDTVHNLCPGKIYQFSAWVKTLNDPTQGGTLLPNISFLVDGIGLYSTGDIIPSAAGSPDHDINDDWQQVGFTFKATGSTTVVSMRNNVLNNTGAYGNDFALDDIYVGNTCAPGITINTLNDSICLVPNSFDSALVTDPTSSNMYYQWQVDKQDGNGYVVAQTPQTATFVSIQYKAYVALPDPTVFLNSGWVYRLVIAADSNSLSSPTCSFISPDSNSLPLCGTVLPVTMASIKAVSNNGMGEVFWQVGDQLNVDHYELQKSMNGGVSFSDVMEVPADNTPGASLINYIAIDSNMSGNINYYRIKVVNNNETYSYSDVVKLTEDDIPGKITIFPNPVTEVLYVSIPPHTIVNNAIIIDAIGRKLMEKGNLTNGEPIDVSNLAPGFYSIRFITDLNSIINISFIKK